MHRQSSAILAAALLAFGAGCGAGDNKQVIDDAKGQNCGAAAYTPFNAANHASQDQRIALQATIGAMAADALADITKAPAVFAEIEGLYASTADLQAKVQGRADDHFPDDAEAKAVGKAIDADIVAGIARGKGATAEVDVDIAKEIIDKSLTRFWYLSVYHELIEGDRVTYDEAFGYLGTGAKNDASGLLSIASVAAKRDATNGTTYEKQLFEGILAGSCAIDKALKAADAESLDWKSDEAYAKVVAEIDGLMLKVLAASVGHELFEPLATADPEEAKVAFHEGAHYFFAVEKAMIAMGGSAATDAAKIRAMVDAAKTKLDAGDAGWLAGFDSDFVRDRVASAFGVTVKG